MCAVQATAAIAGEAVIAVVVAAIRAAKPLPTGCILIRRKGLFRFILGWIRITLESLEKAVFPFASDRGLEYLVDIDGFAPVDGFASPMGSSSS
jgi:hypothetical protein